MADNHVPIDLIERLIKVDLATIGHFAEDGFVDSNIKIQNREHHITSHVDPFKIVGPAVTVRIADFDAVAVNRALLQLTPGSVLVVDMGGDVKHAPLGAVTVAAAMTKGAIGAVVDGVVTDIRNIQASGFPVYARGTSCLTTKRKFGNTSAVMSSVMCGGVIANPGDLVLADSNGVIVMSPAAAAQCVKLAEESDAAEPAILRRIESGEDLSTILALVDPAAPTATTGTPPPGQSTSPATSRSAPCTGAACDNQPPESSH